MLVVSVPFSVMVRLVLVGAEGFWQQPVVSTKDGLMLELSMVVLLEVLPVSI